MNLYFVKQLNADAQENAGSAEPVGEASAATPTTPVETAQAAAPVEKPQTPVAEIDESAHDDFDWSIDKRHVSSYSKEEKEKYDKVYDSTFVQLNDGELVTGTVVGLTKTDVVINIGFKSDGLVPLNEFRDMPGLKIGDEVEVTDR